MKIGVLFTVYNCEDYLRDCLNPWFELKDKYNIIFASKHKKQIHEKIYSVNYFDLFNSIWSQSG